MSQQLKFKGTALFNGRALLPGSMVLITSEKGIVQDIVHESEAGEDIQQFNGLLCPGFVNTHCHLELSHMAGLVPEGTGLPAFLTSVMEKRGQQDVAAQEAAMKKAATTMWESGISAVGDICNGTATLALKQDSPLYYHSFIECMGFVPDFARQRYEYSLDVLREFSALNGPQHSCSIVPHAPYSVTDTLFEMLAATPDNTPISIHNQECEAENSLYQNKTGAFLGFYSHFNMDTSGFKATGTNSLPAWLPWFRRLPVLLVHNTYTTEKDITFTKGQAAQTYWCLCPQANLYIEKRLPDIALLRSLGCTITLGTDSLASNHNLSIWQEIQTIRRQYPTIALEEILQWATLNGAAALGVTARYGSFDKGTQPGVVLIDERDTRRIL